MVFNITVFANTGILWHPYSAQYTPQPFNSRANQFNLLIKLSWNLTMQMISISVNFLRSHIYNILSDLPGECSPHTTSVLLLPGCFSVLPMALQLEENETYQHRAAQQPGHFWLDQSQFSPLKVTTEKKTERKWDLSRGSGGVINHNTTMW